MDPVKLNSTGLLINPKGYNFIKSDYLNLVSKLIFCGAGVRKILGYQVLIFIHTCLCNACCAVFTFIRKYFIVHSTKG